LPTGQVSIVLFSLV